MKNVWRCLEGCLYPLNKLNLGMIKPCYVSFLRLAFVNGIEVIPSTDCKVRGLMEYSKRVCTSGQARFSAHSLVSLLRGTCRSPLKFVDSLLVKWILKCLVSLTRLLREGCGPRGLGQ